MKGWIFDVYPVADAEMTIWFVDDEGSFQMFKDHYEPEFYVGGSLSKLEELRRKVQVKDGVDDCVFSEMRAKLRDFDKSTVLDIKCNSMEAVRERADEIIWSENYRDYKLYNVDVSPDQTYLHEKELFPLARCRLKNTFDTKFELLDSSEATDYEVPPLKYARLEVKSSGSDSFADFTDPVGKISIDFEDGMVTIEGTTEDEMILRLVTLMKEVDPDVILTKGGDSWDIPYLARRAKMNDISDRLVLGRENRSFEGERREGASFHSYGRVYYKPPAHHLKGRIHIDTNNSFIYDKCGIQGLMELSRVTRTPLQKTARSSIGSAMTNLQLYWAQKNDVLIPWKRSEVEDFKSGLKLLEADKGGFIYEPKIGIYEDVGEIDFGSFYPSLMEKYNISPETVLCDCCPDSCNRVPGIGYNICENRRGIIPQILEPVIEKRRKYKEMANGRGKNSSGKIFDQRQDALKWILVTCFGYLGYRKARFGRIEAHESVTAFARENLKKASRISEERGFEIIHGIVDSLWVKKRDLKSSDLVSLCEAIEDELGLSISPEGKYRWIVFPSSKESDGLPVVNRYYGAFENGEMKVKGLASKRGDTPELLVEVQEKILKRLSNARDAGEVEQMIPSILGLLEKYAEKIRSGSVSPEELAISKRLSRDPTSYENTSRNAAAAKQLLNAGVQVRAGQTVSYVVTDSDAENPNFRVKPPSLLKSEKYDKEWYLDSLMDVAAEILNPFSWSEERIREEVLRSGKQSRFGRN